MRTAAFVLSLLAGVAFIALGGSWLGGMDELRASVDVVATEATDAELARFEKAVYSMVAAGLLAFAGGVVALAGKARAAGGILVVSCAIVGLFSPRFPVVMLMLVGLIVATTLAFLSRETTANESPQSASGLPGNHRL